MPDMPPIAGEPVVPGAAPAPGAFASPQSRIVIIVAAVVVFLAVVGAVAALVLLNLGKGADQQSTVNAVNSALASPSASGATRTVETTSQGTKLTLPVTNQDVFVSRDPFQPVLQALPAAVESSETTIPASERNVLVLEDIVTTNGELRAVLKWDGLLIANVAPNDILKNPDGSDSPWKVLTITKTTVTLLYGDVQVTLSIGEGVQKG